MISITALPYSEFGLSPNLDATFHRDQPSTNDVIQ